MTRAFLILLVCTLRASAADSPQARPFSDGTYVGMEPMSSLSPGEPRTRWLHENTLTIKGDAVTLSKSPVCIKKGKKFYSASDGGFYTYRGTLNVAERHWRVEVLLTDSDYAAVPIGPDGKPLRPEPQQFTITPTKDGSLRVGKVTYRVSDAK
jgi:hypothetical protein